MLSLTCSGVNVACDSETVTPKKGKGKGKKKATKTPESTSTSRIENYVGVAVRVTFTGKSDETHLLQQLSGGQKSIVVRALQSSHGCGDYRF